MVNRQGRKFQIWEYLVSHQLLVIRSPSAEERSGNIDLFFTGVRSLSLPTSAVELDLVEVVGDGESDELRRHDRIFVASTEAGRFEIIASTLVVDENVKPLFESVYADKTTTEEKRRRVLFFLSELVDFCAECNEATFRDWFEKRLAILRGARPESDEFRRVLVELDRSFVAKDSFATLSLSPAPGSNQTAEKLRIYQMNSLKILEATIVAMLELPTRMGEAAPRSALEKHVRSPLAGMLDGHHGSDSDEPRPLPQSREGGREVFADRTFQVWQYLVANGSLLIRSPSTASQPRNIDLIFTGVRFLSVPTILKGLEIVEVFEESRVQQMGDQLGVFLEGDRIFWGSTEAGRIQIVARTFRVEENDKPFFEGVFGHKPTREELRHGVLIGLTRLVELGRECNEATFHGWFEERLVILRGAQTESDEFRQVLVELYKSITDGDFFANTVHLTPASGSRRTVDQLYIVQWEYLKLLEAALVPMLLATQPVGLRMRSSSTPPT